MSKSTCIFEGCVDGEARSRGLCMKHYQVARNAGNLDDYEAHLVQSRHRLSSVDRTAKTAECSVCGLVDLYARPDGSNQCAAQRRQARGSTKRIRTLPLGMSDREKFETIGWAVQEHGCWEWLGGPQRGKYGSAPVNSFGAQSAHRFSYQLHFGQIGSDEHVHHVCANAICVNPMHLQAVTLSENTAEMLHRHAYLREIKELRKEVRALKRQLREVA